MSAIKPYLLICVFIIYARLLTAQVQDKLLLTRITTQQGLSSNEVKCIFQDSRGFIWIGTYDGLNRYDGRNIKVYHKNIADSNSLINNWVNSIVEDDKGNLWIGTAGGVSRFNAASSKFTNFSAAKLFNGIKPLAGEQVVFKDTSGNIWVTSGGLSRYNPQTGLFIPQPFLPPTPVHGYSKNQLVITAIADKTGNFWLGTMDGLYRYNVATKQYTRFNDNPAADAYKKDGDLLSCLTLLPGNNVLAVPWSGNAYVFSVTQQLATPQKVITLPNITGSKTFTVTWQGKKEYWVTHNAGIVRLNENLQSFTEWPSAENASSPNGLPKDINYLFQSKEGIIFISTSSGLVILNPYLQAFKTFNFPALTGSFGKIAGEISAMGFTGDTILAASLNSNALYLINSNWQIVRVIPHFGNLTGASANNIYDIAPGTGGDWWITTFQGLVKFNPQTLQYKIYAPPDNDSLSYRHRRFYLVRCAGNKIWLANYKQDVLCFNTLTETFSIYKPYPTQKSIWGLAVTRHNDVWFSCSNMLGRYNPATNRFDIITNSLDSSISMENIVEGKDDGLWIASDNGILRYNTQTGEWRNWSTADGLCNNYVDKLLFDKKGRLWLTTSNGIAAFDTTQKIFYNFTTHEGLPADEWNGALAADAKGNILLGGNNLVAFFDPGVAIRPSKNYPAYITNCQVNGSDYALPQDKHIWLTYNQNNLNFQFTVVNLLQPFQTSFYYKLEGFDKSWHLSPTGIINYTNLDAAAYVLRVSSNPSGNGGNNDALYITIHRAFWKTWWFITGLIVLAVASITFGVRMRINHIKAEANRRATISQQLADLRMRALRSQMNPHFLFNSLNAIQECCLTGQVDAATQYLARFSKLVRYILENSSRPWVSLHEEIEMLRLYLDVESLRFTGSFNFSIENNTRLNDGLIKIPPMLVQPFVENAIWHGLMHKNGERCLWIRFYNDEEKLFIEVEDNGVGRSNKNNGHKSMGMGIVKERMQLIEEMQKFAASMQVTDKKHDDGSPAGTLIKLTLPII